MKNLFSIFVCLLILNCGSSKAEKSIKIKTFKTEELTLSYPNTWVKFGAIGHVYFMPKKIKESTFENEVEHVSVNKNVIQLDNTNQIEKALNQYGNTLTRNQVKKNFELIKINTESKFIYKIESLITYNFSSKTYKRIEYFYKHKDQLKYYTYQMRDSLFDQYKDDAMLIINSIKGKN